MKETRSSVEGNFTKGRTDWLCQELREHGVSENVFKEVKKKLKVEVGFNSVEGGGRYSLMKEKLEKEEKNSGGLSKEDIYLKVLGEKHPETRRVLPEMFKKQKEEYEKALEILNQYCSLHKELMDEEQQFLIHYMYGMIYVHLQDYKKAVISFNQSQKILERAWQRDKDQKKDIESHERKEGGWTEGLLGEELHSDIKKRIRKNTLKLERQRSEEVGSVEHLLAESSLIDGELVKKDFGKERVENLFKEMKTCAFNEKILEYLACSILEEGSRTSVIFTEHEIPSDRDAEGYYGNRNTIRIFPLSYSSNNVSSVSSIFELIHKNMSIISDSNVRETALHEIVHWALNKLFNNVSRPYKRGDEEAIEVHNKAIKEVLWNMERSILAIEDLKNLKEENLIKVKDKISIDLRLEQAFTEDMDVESLAKNIIELSKLIDQEIINILPFDSNYDDRLRFEPKIVKGNKEGLSSIFESVKIVFEKYFFEARDVEFITCVFIPATLTPGFKDGPLAEIFKPYTDYLEKYVIPKLEEVVVNHPKYGLLER